MTPDERKKLLANLREYANELTFDGLLAFDAANEIERLVKEKQDIWEAFEKQQTALFAALAAAKQS